MIEEYEYDLEDLKQEEKQRRYKLLPLLRLRIEYQEEIKDIRTYKIEGAFMKRVGNPGEIIKLIKKKRKRYNIDEE